MNKRLTLRILLSLLLLISQQMAMVHGLSHWRSAAGAPARVAQAAKSGKNAPLVADQACEQCLAFAQIAGAVGSDARRFVPPDQGSCAVAERVLQPCSKRNYRPFDSRAPPLTA